MVKNRGHLFTLPVVSCNSAFGKVCQWTCYVQTKVFDEFLVKPSFSMDNFGLRKPIRSLIDGRFNTKKWLDIKTELVSADQYKMQIRSFDLKRVFMRLVSIFSL